MLGKQCFLTLFARAFFALYTKWGILSENVVQPNGSYKKNASFFGLLECHFSRERKVAFLMKIKYEFVDGDVELEVSDEWASVLAELDRLERIMTKRKNADIIRLRRVHMRVLIMQ